MTAQSNACISLLLAACLFSSCSPDKKPVAAHLGEIQFEVSGKAEAQPAFTRGMLLLHSFEYADAREAFAEARTIDPDFVMAYWGEAMTYNHPLWQEQDYDKGNEVLQVLAGTPEDRVKKAVTELEKDFLTGIHILYGPGDKATRDSTYAMHMERLYQKYPGNDEVAAFYSLALNGWGTTETDKSILEKAAKIGFEVLERNPKHPGALHYVIHAYDDPKYADKALAIADQYAEVAPDAGHALHMPTHTYVALGLWDKVVTSNIVSWKAEKARKEKKNLDNSALGYHAYHWLQYGHLQSGNTETARAMVDSMNQYCSELPNPRARSHMVYLKTTYLAESGDYPMDLAQLPVDLKGLNISTRAKDYFVHGMALCQQKNKRGLDSLILAMADARVTEELKTPAKGIRMCGNINRAIATKNDLRVCEAMEMELRAMRALLDEDNTAAETYFRKAIQLEDECGYAYGPPEIIKPAHEMYAEWLLENGRAAEALAQFEQSLKLAPNRRLSVAGKEKALTLL